MERMQDNKVYTCYVFITSGVMLLGEKYIFEILFLVGQYLNIFFSETIWPNKATFYRKHLCRVLYEISSFHPLWTRKHGHHWQFLFQIG